MGRGGDKFCPHPTQIHKVRVCHTRPNSKRDEKYNSKPTDDGVQLSLFHPNPT
jgi:hypothetical protein